MTSSKSITITLSSDAGTEISDAENRVVERLVEAHVARAYGCDVTVETDSVSRTQVVARGFGDEREAVEQGAAELAQVAWEEACSVSFRDQGDLHDYATGDCLRPATAGELAASKAAGPEGVITVGERSVYVVGEDTATDTAEEATRKGTESGAEAVDDYLQENGRTALLELSVGGWDEAAINAGAHRFDKVSDLYSEAYYAAYEAGARAR